MRAIPSPRERAQQRFADTRGNGFVIYDHQGKGTPFAQALAEDYREFPKATFYRNLAFVLSDSDLMGRRVHLRRHKELGARAIFVYPHTARPNLVHDVAGIGYWDGVTCQFVVTEGHADVMRAYGYPLPLHPVGWSLCPLHEFTPRKEPRKVLFAPIHPRCSVIDMDVNREVFKRLFKLAKQDDIDLTVRFINSLWKSGLDEVNHPNVHYEPGQMNQMYASIDNADVVVGHQTFPWLSVARGVPTVMMAEDMPTHIEPKNKSVRYAQNWEKYHHLIAYPLDILATDDTLGILRRAVKDDTEIADWRTRMIGEQFDPVAFRKTALKYL